MRIKSTTYSDVKQKPCQFYWQGLLHITIDSELSNTAVVARSRIVFLRVPIGVTSQVLREIAPALTSEHLLVDLTSVKTPFLEILSGLHCEVLSLHPMFAPSVGLGHGQSCVSCSIRPGERSGTVLVWFSERGIRMIPMELRLTTPVRYEKGLGKRRYVRCYDRQKLVGNRTMSSITRMKAVNIVH
jgi:hypothetical protein